MRYPSDRPTMPPALDMLPEAPQSEVRMATRPEMRAALTDEAWAGRMAGSPVVVMGVESLKRLPLDHRAGFLLSLMDGAIDLDTMVEIAGMPRAVALRMVRDLFESGVVDFRT